MIEVVGELDFTFGPRHLPVKARAIVGKSGPRIDRTDGAMDVQIVGVTMHDRNAPMVDQAESIKNLPDVCMYLFIGQQPALAFVP
ncbi:MAG TPA: hypothetical protein VNF68_07435 [Candidatus Baltobacteraceae bacterium]|nr:hypothetical protein [Candidatus Baltobacteraceae bacterium]